MLQAVFFCKVCVACVAKDSHWILLGFHKGEKYLGRDGFGKCIPLCVEYSLLMNHIFRRIIFRSSTCKLDCLCYTLGQEGPDSPYVARATKVDGLKTVSNGLTSLVPLVIKI